MKGGNTKMTKQKTVIGDHQRKQIMKTLTEVRDFLDNWYLPELDMKDAKRLSNRLASIKARIEMCTFTVNSIEDDLHSVVDGRIVAN